MGHGQGTSLVWGTWSGTRASWLTPGVVPGSGISVSFTHKIHKLNEDFAFLFFHSVQRFLQKFWRLIFKTGHPARKIILWVSSFSTLREEFLLEHYFGQNKRLFTQQKNYIFCEFCCKIHQRLIFQDWTPSSENYFVSFIVFHPTGRVSSGTFFFILGKINVFSYNRKITYFINFAVKTSELLFPF